MLEIAPSSERIMDGLREPTWEHSSGPDWKTVAKDLAVALDLLTSGVVDPRKAAKWPMVQVALDNYYRALKE